MSKLSISTGRGYAQTTAALLVTGIALVVTSFVASIVAGVSIADVFGGDAGAADQARDQGVFRAVSAWAPALGLLGIATIFSAIYVALVAIRKTHIPSRRDAMVTTLPTLLGSTQGTHQ